MQLSVKKHYIYFALRTFLKVSYAKIYFFRRADRPILMFISQSADYVVLNNRSESTREEKDFRNGQC